MAKDLLSGLDKDEREILWMARYIVSLLGNITTVLIIDRYNFVKNPDVLPKLLLCVDWYEVIFLSKSSSEQAITGCAIFRDLKPII